MYFPKANAPASPTFLTWLRQISSKCSSSISGTEVLLGPPLFLDMVKMSAGKHVNHVQLLKDYPAQMCWGYPAQKRVSYVQLLRVYPAQNSWGYPAQKCLGYPAHMC